MISSHISINIYTHKLNSIKLSYIRCIPNISLGLFYDTSWTPTATPRPHPSTRWGSANWSTRWKTSAVVWPLPRRKWFRLGWEAAGSGLNFWTMDPVRHNWLVVWNMAFMTFHILGIMIPTDFHIFQRGRSTTHQIKMWVVPLAKNDHVWKEVIHQPHGVWQEKLYTCFPQLAQFIRIIPQNPSKSWEPAG